MTHLCMIRRASGRNILKKTAERTLSRGVGKHHAMVLVSANGSDGDLGRCSQTLGASGGKVRAKSRTYVRPSKPMCASTSPPAYT
jgi:7-keto-8-aminopelargonate synthetase-like enzyme